MQIQTERLILRNYKSDDWERVHLYAGDPEFSQYEPWGPNSIADTQTYVNQMAEQAQFHLRFKFDFAICLKDTGLLIGGCGIRREAELSAVAHLGWAIHPDYQKRGFASEAARGLLDYGFRQLGLKIIYATCDTRNVASARVMEKLGMKKVGTIRGTQPIKGHLRDSFRYEITSATSTSI